MSLLMILLLLLPLLAYIISRWLPENFLLNHTFLSSLGITVSSLIGIGIFIIIRLINTADYVQTFTVTWFKIADYTYTISLMLNPSSGWILALLAASVLVIIVLISIIHFEPRNFRESLINLTLSIFAINGLILTNDLLTMLLFWALLDLCAYRIALRNGFDMSVRSFDHYLIIFGNLLLFLAVCALFRASNTLQIDLIIGQISAGEIPTIQLLFPGTMLALAGIIRILQPWLSSNSTRRAEVQPGDQFIIYSGIIPTGLLLIIKLLSVLPNTCFQGLIIVGGLSSLIVAVAITGKNNFKQFLRLYTILQLSLVLITLGIKATYIVPYLLFQLILLNLLLINFIRDFQPENGVQFPGSALAMPIRLVLLFSVIGLPLTSVFNSRLFVLETAASFGIAGSAGRTGLVGLVSLIIFLSTAATFRLFMITGAMKPARRKTAPISPKLQWLMAGLAILCLYPVLTLPRLNPLTTALSGMILFSGNLADNCNKTVNTIVILHAGLLFAGLLTGFIFSKYLQFANFISRLASFNTSLYNRSLVYMNKHLSFIIQKVLRFDMVLMPKFGQQLTGFLTQAIDNFNRINERCGQQFAKSGPVPTANPDTLFHRIRKMESFVLPLIVLLILTIIVLICII